MRTVIKVDNLSKAYQLGTFGTGTISRDLERYWAKIRGNDDPFLKIGEENDRSVKGESDIVWSLNNINFEVEQGDAIGIIGRNGAGKSTLLKILSRVTSPTSGSVKVRGRIASLLEVGTGFHPELSGKENIYLNGSILGMRKKEITRQLDAIIDFAGVERYIDTPVKRYSSGMYVRLAFAVAAHLESEILIVDEVLAVGDAEFQKKCLGKMGQVSKSEGRTVLFVSHNMAAVQRLCAKSMLLSQGECVEYAATDQVVNKYVCDTPMHDLDCEIPLPADSEAILGYAYRLRVEDESGNLANNLNAGDRWQVRVWFKLNRKVEHFIIALGITSVLDVNLRTSWSEYQDLGAGNYEVIFKEHDLLLAAGVFTLGIGLSSFEKTFHYIPRAGLLTISDVPAKTLHPSIIRTSGTGFFLNPLKISISPITI